MDIVRALVLNPEPIGAVKAQGDKEAFRGWEIQPVFCNEHGVSELECVGLGMLVEGGFTGDEWVFTE